MTAFVSRRGRRPRLILATALLGIVIATSASLGSSQAADPVPVSSVGEPITVYLDQATIIKMPERTATLVVGNPLIADVSVQPGGIIVVTGKSYGVTNMVALDRLGTMLMEHPIQVQGPRDKMVVLYRGIERETYSCAPVCERRITIGDTPQYFGTILQQTGTINQMAQQGGRN